MDKDFCEDIAGSGEPAKKNDPLKVVQIQQSPESLSSFEIGRAVQDIILSSSDTLDLSRKNICHLNEDIFQVSNIKHLHLQGNDLPWIPEDFFQQLSNLVWLDLRFNRITSLPPGVGAHRHLKSLLLEGNPITSLPVQLGDLTSLKALNLRNCPLEFPPIEVVQRGLPAIQSFLQKARVGQWEPLEKPLQEMPPVEKLKLTGLMKSSLELSEEWPNEGEMRLFQNLKQQIMQNEKDEFFQGQRLALEDGSRHNRKDLKEKPVHSVRKKTMFSDPLVYDVKIKTKRDEERKLSALKELKEQQTNIEQRKRDQVTLLDWRKQTKKMQENKELKELPNSACRFPPATRDKVPKSAPYATDLDRNPFVDSTEQKKTAGSKHQDKNRRMSLKTVNELERERSARDIELEQRIKKHIQLMQEKRKRPNEMQAAKEDLDKAEILQTHVLQLKAEEPSLEYRFKAFTGDLSPPRTPTGEPPKLFSKLQ